MAAVAMVQAQDVPVYGNWAGQFVEKTWAAKSLTAQIVGESRDTYRVDLFIDGKQFNAQAVDAGKYAAISQVVNLGKELGGQYILTGFIEKGKFSGSLISPIQTIEFLMERVADKSPTFGLKAPEGAIVLIGGEEMPQQERHDLFYNNWNVQPHWVVSGDGSVHMSGSNIFTKQEFGDAQIHVEFMCPYMPEDRGQARGNSGVYVMGRYEVQVLDSFTDTPQDNLCGGVYQFGVPKEKASFPPMTWQTYDITISAPKFEGEKKVKDAVLTVVHNGIKVHDNLVLSRCTPGGVSGKEAPVGCLLFQDHGNTVRFRNVWVKPLN
jgi:hypothetical protein